MPMEYLRELPRDQLPRIETDVACIDKLRVLSAAGMVEAELPAPDDPRPRARVLAVTGLGCATLRLYERAQEPRGGPTAIRRTDTRTIEPSPR